VRIFAFAWKTFVERFELAQVAPGGCIVVEVRSVVLFSVIF
jgi:hypothetical protein